MSHRNPYEPYEPDDDPMTRTDIAMLILAGLASSTLAGLAIWALCHWSD